MSVAIRWYLNSEFSHTYFKIQLPGLTDSSVLQANGQGVGICSYMNFKKKNAVIKEFDIEISDELFLEIYNEFHDRSGVKYGYIQNLGILLSEQVGLRINPFQDGMVCSEYLAYCLEEIFPDDWNSATQDFNLVTPKTVYDYLLVKLEQ